jgi:hypothetical protein
MNRVSTGKLAVYLEAGSRRTFAAALDWPGWCRMGRDEAAALQALLDTGPRYARVLRSAGLEFRAPGEVSAFVVVERLTGNATTDFGAPGMVPAGDAQPLDDAGLQRLQLLLAACWRAFDEAVAMAEGEPLRTGPRGGGRTLDGIVQHVLGGEAAYLAQLGGKAPSADSAPPSLAPPSSAPIREAILCTLQASARGEIAEFGPRGGKRWSPRYFVRRDAWHLLDHAWEIEDRLEAHAE